MFFNQFFDFDGMHGGGFGTPFQNQSSPVDTHRLYDILGVDKNASESEIRKAYRILAKQNHPDKGGNSAKFQEISYANEILSNPEKRKLYDQYGEEGLKCGDDGMSAMSRASAPKRTKDVKQKIVCSLEDLYKGKRINMKITHKIVCKACNGRGGGDHYMMNCDYCHGSGQLSVEVPGFMFQRRMVVQCDYCNGSGVIFDDSKQCSVCHGKRVVTEQKQTDFYLERGMVTGSVIRLHGAADESPGYEAGDVLLIVQERPHPVFQRDGADLLMHMKVSLGEALCGFVRSFIHLDGRKICVGCKPGEVVKPGSMKIIPGEGMPVGNDGFKKGSLFIVFDVEFPAQLSTQQQEVLKSVLGVPTMPIPEHTDSYVLQDADNVQYGNSVPGYQKPVGDVLSDSSEEERPGTECQMQ